MSTTLELERLIADLPENVVTSINDTLNSDVPILTRQWAGLVDEVPCGCLLADGLAQRAPDLWDDLYSGNDEADILINFYDLHSWDIGSYDEAEDIELDADDRLGNIPGFRLYQAYDEWAMQNKYATRVGNRMGLAPTPEAEADPYHRNYAHFWTWTLNDEGREILKGLFAQELINRATS